MATEMKEETRMTDFDRLEVPQSMTCFQLNSDGTYQLGSALRCSVYIDERQVAKIWDPQVAKFIRENYGPYVGVMHFIPKNLNPPVYPTFKFVLGG